MERKKLTDKKQIGKLFALCFFAYFSTYLGRLNYSASLAEMVRTEGFTRGMAGLIGTGFFCTYGIGQLASGFLGDRLSGKWMVFGGLFVSGCMNGIMGCLHTTQMMTAAWCLNGMAQAFIWSPMLQVICDLLDADARTGFCLYINFSVPLGTVSSYGLSALMIGQSGWRAAFYAPCIMLLAMACIWLAGIRRFDTAPEKKAWGRSPAERNMPAGKEHIFLPSGLLFLTAALCVQGALKDGITVWIPTYLEETHNIGSMAAILGTMIIPLCNLAGVFMASLVNRSLGRNEVLTASVFFGTCGMALVVLLCWGRLSAALALGMLAVATTSMTSVNTMLISVLPARFGELGKASSVSGILNSCVYAGCAVSTYGIGALSEAMGWNKTIFLWIAGAFAALGLCLLISRRWKVYVSRTLL